jgi:sialic acid synthase SpsE
MDSYIIAEMAWSHTGSLDRAMEMLEGASKAGANAISIHITDMPNYMVRDYKCLAGTTLSDSADQNVSIYDFLTEINFSHEQWKAFDERAQDLSIDLIVMCNDSPSFEFSKELKVYRYVLSAASFLETELIADMLAVNPDIILRTGGATMEEVKRVVDDILMLNAKASICLLAGIQLYPTPIKELHLASLASFAEQFKDKGVSVGLADHIDGDHPFAIALPSIALAFGAKVLEKHITTDRKEKLEDYEAALGIDQFAEFVNAVRTTEVALGDGTMSYMNDNDSYKKYRMVTRKKVVAATDLLAGTVLTKDMLTFKRADHGAQLDALGHLIGRPLALTKKRDEGVNLEDVSSI